MEIFKKRLTIRTHQKNVPQMKRTLIYTKNKHKHIKLFLKAFKSLSGALHSNSKRYQFHAGVVSTQMENTIVFNFPVAVNCSFFILDIEISGSETYSLSLF